MEKQIWWLLVRCLGSTTADEGFHGVSGSLDSGSFCMRWRVKTGGSLSHTTSIPKLGLSTRSNPRICAKHRVLEGEVVSVSFWRKKKHTGGKTRGEVKMNLLVEFGQTLDVGWPSGNVMDAHSLGCRHFHHSHSFRSMFCMGVIRPMAVYILGIWDNDDVVS